MEKEDVVFLNQMANALDESVRKLEEQINSSDKYLVDRTKDFILQLNKKIDGIIS